MPYRPYLRFFVIAVQFKMAITRTKTLAHPTKIPAMPANRRAFTQQQEPQSIMVYVVDRDGGQILLPRVLRARSQAFPHKRSFRPYQME